MILWERGFYKVSGRPPKFHLRNSKGKRSVCSIFLPEMGTSEVSPDPPEEQRCAMCQRHFLQTLDPLVLKGGPCLKARNMVEVSNEFLWEVDQLLQELRDEASRTEEKENSAILQRAIHVASQLEDILKGKEPTPRS